MNQLATKESSWFLNTNIQNIIASNYYVSEVSRRLITFILGGSFKNNVHVAVAIYHLPSVLNMVLQPDSNFLIYLLNEQVQRLLRWFQDYPLLMCTSKSL